MFSPSKVSTQSIVQIIKKANSEHIYQTQHALSDMV